MPNQISPQIQLPEPDHEGRMAKSELYRAAKMSIKLFQMIQDGQELEGWVQAKITKSADYLDSIYHYMEYQMKFGQGGQAASVADIAGDMDIGARAAPEEEDDEDVKVKESLSYEQRLQGLLEGKVKKAKEGNAFGKAIQDAKAKGSKTASVDGKPIAVKEAAKPDFLDIDKDGDKKEPMKKAVADKKAGPKKGVNPFAKKDAKVKEGFSNDAKTGDTFKTAKGTATKTATGMKHTRDKYEYDPGSDDKDDKKAKRVAKKKVSEVSSATLKSYKDKADKEVVGHLTGEKDSKNVMKRWKGADKAGDKMAKKDESAKQRGQRIAEAAIRK